MIFFAFVLPVSLFWVSRSTSPDFTQHYRAICFEPKLVEERSASRRLCPSANAMNVQVKPQPPIRSMPKRAEEPPDRQTLATAKLQHPDIQRPVRRKSPKPARIDKRSPLSRPVRLLECKRVSPRKHLRQSTDLVSGSPKREGPVLIPAPRVISPKSILKKPSAKGASQNALGSTQRGTKKRRLTWGATTTQSFLRGYPKEARNNDKKLQQTLERRQAELDTAKRRLEELRTMAGQARTFPKCINR